MEGQSLNDTKGIENTGKELGEKYVDEGVTTSQLRQIYSEVKRAESEFKFEGDSEKAKQTLTLLKPRLAYTASRHDEMEAVNDDILGYINAAINGDDRKMRMFFQLMEAVVAYHAYFGETGGR
jgi:CRISPR type III-A-associated protein Csm2